MSSPAHAIVEALDLTDAEVDRELAELQRRADMEYEDAFRHFREQDTVLRKAARQVAMLNKVRDAFERRAK